MADDKKKISELQEIAAIEGTENLLLGVTGGNKRATTEAFKEYVGASVTRVFTEQVNGRVNIINGAATPEEVAVMDVVYLTDMGLFASRKAIGSSVSYFSEWNGREDYQTDSVRADRVFFCTKNRTVYVFNNGKLTEQVNEGQSEINSKVKEWKETTEEELESMMANGTWKEGVIYYTVEE